MTRPMHDYTKVQNRNNQVRQDQKVEQKVPVEVFEEVETETEETVEEEPKLDDPIQGTIYKCKVINLRSKPSLDAEILTRLHAGDVVQIDGEEDGWFAVITQIGVEGYLVKDYVEV